MIVVNELVNDIKAAAKPSKTINDLAEEAFIPQGVEIPKPESVFEMDGISVFTKKSLSTLIGKAKSGKTTCTAWVTAQMLKENIKVLWIDTEQGLYYSSRTQHWVLAIYGEPKCPNLQFYDLKVHGPTKRIEIIEVLIPEFEPDIVILDGIRDLVFDINEPKEATNTVQKLMQWAEEYNCHVLSIIHQNKGDQHARGHLGTEMINKSETVIKVEKDEDKKLTVCSPEFTRSEPFPIFAFERDGAGMPMLVNYHATITVSDAKAKKLLPVNVNELTHYETLKRAFGSEDELHYTEMIPAVSAAFEYISIPMGITRSKEFLQFYIQEGYIVKTEKKGKFQYYKIQFISHAKTILKPTGFYEKDDEAPF